MRQSFRTSLKKDQNRHELTLNKNIFITLRMKIIGKNFEDKIAFISTTSSKLQNHRKENIEILKCFD